MAQDFRLLSDYRWENRLLLVFAEDESDPLLQRQLEMLADAGEGIDERDLLIWQITYNGDVLRDGTVMPDYDVTEFYARFEVPFGHFSVILVGKDGGEKLREWQPLTVKRLFDVIDAMPMRQMEMFN